MEKKDRMYTLIGAALCCAGAAVLYLDSDEEASQAAQDLQDQASALLADLGGAYQSSVGAGQPQPPPAPQPAPAQPAPVRPGQRVPRR